MGKMNINRIGGSNPITTERQSDVRATAKDTARPHHRRAAVAEDKLEFSSKGSEVGSLVDQVKQLPDVREAKVSSLRSQITSGSYNPSNQQIADAIIKDEKS